MNSIITDIDNLDDVEIALTTDSDYNNIIDDIDKGKYDMNGLLASLKESEEIDSDCTGCCDVGFDNSVDPLDIDADEDIEIDQSLDEDEENGEIIDIVIGDE